MLQNLKKRKVVSYENMSEELATIFEEKYPKGFNDYLPDIVKYTKPDGTPFYAVMVELEDSVVLVKIKVKTDDIEDIESWLSGDDDSSDADSDTIGDDSNVDYSSKDDVDL